tara:strand:+ start:2484 stop:3110 length:627 start_codon:yes stop_codon:yes gene_type:complete
MANIDAAFGLRPYNMLGAGANTNGNMTFTIQTTSQAGTSSVIYQGSPVIPTSTGLVNIVGAAAGGTVPLLGVFLGCNYVDLNGKPVWSPKWPGTSAVLANSVATCEIAAHPDQLFLINCDGAADQDFVHENANFSSATSGNATSGLSSAELAVSTVDEGSGSDVLNMRIVGYADQPNSNDPLVAGRLAIVMLNNHFYRYSTNGTNQGV